MAGQAGVATWLADRKSGASEFPNAADDVRASEQAGAGLWPRTIMPERQRSSIVNARIFKQPYITFHVLALLA